MDKIHIKDVLEDIFNLLYANDVTTKQLISTQFKDMNIDEFDLVNIELKIYDKYKVAFGLGNVTVNSTILDLTNLINNKLEDIE